MVIVYYLLYLFCLTITIVSIVSELWIVAIIIGFLSLIFHITLRDRKSNIEHTYKMLLHNSKDLYLEYDRLLSWEDKELNRYYDKYLPYYVVYLETLNSRFRLHFNKEEEYENYFIWKNSNTKIIKIIDKLHKLSYFTKKHSNFLTKNVLTCFFLLLINNKINAYNETLEYYLKVLSEIEVFFKHKIYSEQQKNTYKKKTHNKTSYENKNTNTNENKTVSSSLTTKQVYLKSFGLTEDNFNESTLKKQYRKLCKKYHPDNNTNSNAKEQFEEVQKRYEYLLKQL